MAISLGPLKGKNKKPQGSPFQILYDEGTLWKDTYFLSISKSNIKEFRGIISMITWFRWAPSILAGGHRRGNICSYQIMMSLHVGHGEPKKVPIMVLPLNCVWTEHDLLQSRKKELIFQSIEHMVHDTDKWPGPAWASGVSLAEIVCKCKMVSSFKGREFNRRHKDKVGRICLVSFQLKTPVWQITKSEPSSSLTRNPDKQDGLLATAPVLTTHHFSVLWTLTQDLPSVRAYVWHTALRPSW